MSTIPSIQPAGVASIADGAWQLDPTQSSVEFHVRHFWGLITVKGAFSAYEGTLDLGGTPAVELVIQADSLDTRHRKRDEHLRSADFLDVETYPEIVFVSTSVDELDDAQYRVTGDLTIKDVTHPVSVDFALTGSAQDPWGNLRVGFEGALAITRSDWGLTWNTPLDTGGVLVSDKITLEFEISAIKAA